MGSREAGHARRAALLRCGAALVAPVLAAVPLAPRRAAAQQDWPLRPVHLVVGFPPGGVTDVLARLVGEALAARLGQAVVVENRPGAAGNLAAEQVARAPADGHALLLGTNASHGSNPSLYRSVPFDPRRDFAPVSLLASITNVLVVHPTVPARSVADLIALARVRPGALNFASAASGSAGHLVGELFKLRTGTDMVHVPYRGAAPAMNDMLAGRVELMFATLQTVLEPVRAGRLRALAVTAPARVPQLPEVPTLAEAGLRGFEADAWFAVFAPVGTPAPVVGRLNDAIRAAMGDPALRERVTALGFQIRLSTPAELDAFVAAELEKWGEAVRVSGARAD